jgi:hypothetical protein
MNMTAKEMKAKNISIPNPWAPEPGTLTLDPRSLRGPKALNISANCPNPTTKPTLCDPRLRTKNTQAECGSAEDVYYWSPWRYPGNAPVIDAWCVFGCAPPRFVSL